MDLMKLRGAKVNAKDGIPSRMLRNGHLRKCRGG
jgi:hypothetical protein